MEDVMGFYENYDIKSIALSALQKIKVEQNPTVNKILKKKFT